VHLFDGAERPLDLAFSTGRCAPLGLFRPHVREHAHAQTTHDGLEYLGAADRAVVHVECRRDALERQLGLRLRRHGVEQETQGRFGVLAVDVGGRLNTRRGA
jgi:hypothetical protein